MLRPSPGRSGSLSQGLKNDTWHVQRESNSLLTVQKDPDLLDHFLLRPGRGDLGVADGADALHFKKLAGAILDDLQDLGAEVFDQSLGEGWPQPDGISATAPLYLPQS